MFGVRALLFAISLSANANTVIEFAPTPILVVTGGFAQADFVCAPATKLTRAVTRREGTNIEKFIFIFGLLCQHVGWQRDGERQHDGEHDQFHGESPFGCEWAARAAMSVGTRLARPDDGTRAAPLQARIRPVGMGSRSARRVRGARRSYRAHRAPHPPLESARQQVRNPPPESGGLKRGGFRAAPNAVQAHCHRGETALRRLWEFPRGLNRGLTANLRSPKPWVHQCVARGSYYLFQDEFRTARRRLSAAAA